MLERAHRRADGSYRTAAGRLLTGKVLGGFRYLGTRPDDPNDIVPHEHRRELRALRVFGAWTNLTDMKAGNTLDTVVTETARHRQTLPPGRGLDLRRRRQRPPRLERGVGTRLERGPAAPVVLLRDRPQPLADRRLRNTRLSGGSRANFDPRPGSRAHRPPPRSRCAPTMPSGRRGGSWLSPTT